MTLEQNPDYHQGFYDAQGGEPIWENECTPEYAAGWRAYWSIRADLQGQWKFGPPSVY